MLVTVTFDITTKDQKTVIEEGLYVDIEVTDEEYERIGESCDTCMFRGMYEDITLREICERCLEVLGEQNSGDEDRLFRFDYPLETRIDRAETVWEAGFDEIAGDELIPTNAKLIENDDGTYTVWWPGMCS